MDSRPSYRLISFLILKERLGTLEPSEAEELESWKIECSQHQELYDQLKQKDLVTAFARYDKIDVEKGLIKYRKRYARRKVRHLWLSAAAVAVVFIGMTVLLLPAREKPSDIIQGNVAGMWKAELVLDDGSVRDLGNIAEEQIITGSAVAYNSGTQLSYRQIKDTSVSSEKFSVYNELRVPTGGEFQLVLGDGTKVWLNSQSRLRYPVVFADSVRRVELTGEAYFEVAHNEHYPFLVQLHDHIQVEVLGTSFNVRDYPDEEVSETVLEEGCVRIVKNEKSVQLMPGMKAVYAKETGSLSTERVNTELYTSWRNGHFVFQNERLEDILHKLSRWYEIQVFFGDENARELLFSGNIRKYDTIEKLLEAIRMAGGVRFEILENRVTVYSENK